MKALALLACLAAAGLGAEPAAHAWTRATLSCADALETGRVVPCQMVMDGQTLGLAPLTLGQVDHGGAHHLEAQAQGWQPASLSGLRLPAEGRVTVYLAPASAGRAWTILGAGLGLGLAAAGLVLWRQDPGLGAGLTGAGLLAPAGFTLLAWRAQGAAQARAQELNQGISKP